MTERWDDFMHYPRICTPRASHRTIEGCLARNLGPVVRLATDGERGDRLKYAG